jgi:23S rRNA (cytidine1920-2'-O)/16S rRNA (cytidine1409-2'-O)-methyltransferase
MRLDVYLVQNGLLVSREMAKFNITKGNVLVNGKRALKPSQSVTDGDSVSLLISNAIPFVSKGGLKLEKAIDEFGINCENIFALDIGASTGGFTDCLLTKGAMHVCAVDVGSNQLDQGLRENPKVTSLENTNIKDLEPQSLNPSQFDLLVADLSFVSLTKVMEYFPRFLKLGGQIVVLIKPQFEVGPGFVSKNGIVKEQKSHVMAIRNVVKFAFENKLHLSKITWSPIHSADKNIEYLALFTSVAHTEPDYVKIVQLAFDEQKRCK